MTHVIHGAYDLGWISFYGNDSGDGDFCRWGGREQGEAQARAEKSDDVRPAHSWTARQQKGKESRAIGDHVPFSRVVILRGFDAPLCQKVTWAVGHGLQNRVLQTKRGTLAQDQFDLHRFVLQQRSRFENGKRRESGEINKGISQV